MAVTAALAGGGLVFSRGGTAITDSYTAIAEVLDFSLSGVTVSTHEASNMDSPSGFKEFITGMADLGEATFELNWNADTATHETLLSDAATVPQTKRFWKIDWPPASAPSATWKQAGYITKFSPKAPVDGKMTASLTIRFTGVTTRT